MEIRRVLTIESVEDSSTRRMLTSIYGSSEFRDYLIEHFFFLKDADIVDEDNLSTRLNEIVNKFKPDAILIHTGGYFLKNKAVFLKTIPKIKEIHTEILIGIERRDICGKDFLEILDNQEELKKIEAIFFRIQRS